MVLSVEQQRVKVLIRDTIALMCKNGLAFNKEFHIDAVIGVTLDNQSLFYMSFNEVIKADQTDELLAEQTVDSSLSEMAPRKKRKAEPGRQALGDRDDSGKDFHLSEPSKEEAGSTSAPEKSERPDDEKPISIKHELDADWDSLATEFASGGVMGPGTSDDIENNLISQTLNINGFDSCARQGSTWLLGNNRLKSTGLIDTGDNSQGEAMVCEICNKRLMSKSTYKIHMNAHKGIFPHYCSYCNKGFTSRRNLRGHLYIHTGIKDYKCDICQQEFSYKVNMKSHKRMIHGVPD